MALPTPTGVMRFIMRFDLLDTSLWSSKFDMAWSGITPNSSSLQAFAEHVGVEFAANLRQELSVNWGLNSVEAIDLQNPSTIAGNALTPVAGTRAGTNLDSGRCACLVFRPDRRYRGGRPKAFLPLGVREDYGTDQTWSEEFITELEAQWTAFIADLDGYTSSSTILGPQKAVFYNGPPYTIVSNTNKTRSHSVPTPLSPPKVVDIQSVYLNQKLGSQRRRL